MTSPLKRFSLIELLVLVAFVAIATSMVAPRACSSARPRSSASTAPAATPPPADDGGAARVEALARQLEPSSKEWRDGLAAVVLVDVSGSMGERVRDAGGARQRKIVVARRAALALVGAFETYARAHPAEAVSVGIYEFSERDGEKAARVVVPPGPPDVEGARARLEAMKANGGTPIGEAMIDARRALDATGLRRRHLLVITDGENTSGPSPVDVARAMDRQDESTRSALYFVAFDVAASSFAEVARNGGLLLSAKDGGELRTTLDELLSDRILVEAPR